MAESGVVAEERPRCSCHDEPMRWRVRKERVNGGGWLCVVKAAATKSRYQSTEKGRASRKRYDESDKGKARDERRFTSEKYRRKVERNVYARGRARLRARIERKRQQIAALEAQLEAQDT